MLVNDRSVVYPAISLSRHRLVTDGEGVTTLAVSFGCPLRCKYCLNPFSFDPATRVRNYTVQELIEALAVDDLYFQATGGGVTFGGGEPLLQYRFLHDFAQARPKEWKLNIETSLNVPEEYLRAVAEDFDFWLVDIKDMNPVTYARYTGKDNTRVLSNLQYLKELGQQKKVRIRVPKIPGFQVEGDTERSVSRVQEMGFDQIDQFTYRISKTE